jgi:hypothetical protein
MKYSTYPVLYIPLILESYVLPTTIPYHTYYFYDGPFPKRTTPIFPPKIICAFLSLSLSTRTIEQEKIQRKKFVHDTSRHGKSELSR